MQIVWRSIRGLPGKESVLGLGLGLGRYLPRVGTERRRRMGSAGVVSVSVCRSKLLSLHSFAGM